VGQEQGQEQGRLDGGVVHAGEGGEDGGRDKNSVVILAKWGSMLQAQAPQPE